MSAEIDPSSFTMKHKFVSSFSVEETSFSSQEIYALLPLLLSTFLLVGISFV